MKLSISITDFTLPGGPDGLAEHLSGVVATADEAGLDTVWVPDHLLQGIPGRAPDRRDAGGLHHARLPGRPLAAGSGSAPR